MIKKAFAFLIILIFLLPSCSREMGEFEAEEGIERADMVLENGTFTLYQDIESPIEFSSSLSSFYSADHSARLEGVTFIQKDENGGIILEGRAERAELDTESRDMVLSGNVSFISYRDDMMIETDGPLSFKSESQEVESESPVSVRSNDIEFKSHSFYGNLLTGSYSFSNLEEGRITI